MNVIYVPTKRLMYRGHILKDPPPLTPKQLSKIVRGEASEVARKRFQAMEEYYKEGVGKHYAIATFYFRSLTERALENRGLAARVVFDAVTKAMKVYRPKRVKQNTSNSFLYGLGHYHVKFDREDKTIRIFADCTKLREGYYHDIIGSKRHKVFCRQAQYWIELFFADFEEYKRRRDSCTEVFWGR